MTTAISVNNGPENSKRSTFGKGYRGKVFLKMISHQRGYNELIGNFELSQWHIFINDDR